MEFSNRIYKSYDQLIINSKPDGKIHEVVNQEEIFQKWKLIEKGELSSYFEGEANAQVRNQMNNEFANSLEYLNKNWFYFFFLFRPSKPIKFQHNIPSELLLGEQLTLEITCNQESIEESLSNWKMQGRLLARNHSTHKSYQNQYELLCGEQYFHEYKLSADYIIEDNKIASCHVVLEESANENLKSISTITIRKIKL